MEVEVRSRCGAMEVKLISLFVFMIIAVFNFIRFNLKNTHIYLNLLIYTQNRGYFFKFISFLKENCN